SRGTEAYVPLLHKIKVPLCDIEEMQWSESKWDFVRERLIENNRITVSDEERSAQFLERKALAEKLFPLPEEGEKLASPEELNNIF
ncbi:MAG: type IV secretory system conjugative DNA transfer family protein, partial [Cyanobacteria bacterium J06649_11]